VYETIIDKSALPEFLLRKIPTSKVRVREVDGTVQLSPVRGNIDCTIGLRGVLSEYSNMSVERFLQRKHADKELDL
jgi:hypothetical protein